MLSLTHIKKNCSADSPPKDVDHQQNPGRLKKLLCMEQLSYAIISS
jgi:hypothetical protein